MRFKAIWSNEGIENPLPFFFLQEMLDHDSNTAEVTQVTSDIDRSLPIVGLECVECAVLSQQVVS